MFHIDYVLLFFGNYIHDIQVESEQCKVVRHVHKVILNTEFSQILPYSTISVQSA